MNFLQFLSIFSQDENKSIKNFIKKLNNKTLDRLNNKQINDIKKDIKEWFPTFFDKKTKKIITQDNLNLNNLNNKKLQFLSYIINYLFINYIIFYIKIIIEKRIMTILLFLFLMILITLIFHIGE